MPIAEPVTTLTDCLLGAASLYFALRLYSAVTTANRTSSRLWVLGFVFSGIAALVGGSFHGFALVLEPSALRSLWNVTMISSGASGAFMLAGVLAASLKKTDESRRWLVRGFVVTLAGFVVQQTGFRHGSDFNHNDAFHVIQIAAQYLFFRGAMLLRD